MYLISHLEFFCCRIYVYGVRTFTSIICLLICNSSNKIRKFKLSFRHLIEKRTDSDKIVILDDFIEF